METEAIDKLFLELSQFTTAKTSREIRLEAAIAGLILHFRELIPLLPAKAGKAVDDRAREAESILIN